jgi:hypothetical protein
MYHILAKTTIIAAIPKIVDEIHKWWKKRLNIKPEVKRSHASRGIYDTRKLTQSEIDLVRVMYNEHLMYNHLNKNNKCTLENLTDNVNEILGTNKSRTTLSKIWNQCSICDSLEK